MNDRARIVQDPKIVGGEPVLNGTRVTLRTVLASLADGDSVNGILQAFPTLSEDVRAFSCAAQCQQSAVPLEDEVAAHRTVP
jgi:uncharacterized protein (DUF433 family)